MENIISFQGLDIELFIKPIAFTIFGKAIYWYGIIIAAGFLAALGYTCARSSKFDIKQDDLLDMLIFATPISIICARIYYVAFRWDYYKDNLASVFAIWEGGIAIYGAVIGAVIVVVVFCRYKDIKFGDMADIGALGLLIGQCVGRWGNFVNAEAFGIQTTLPWGMSINSQPAVHPTFLYESIWTGIGFIVLHYYSKKRKFSGEIFLIYCAWYGFGRMFIEGLRTDSLYIGQTNLRISQIFAFITFAVSTVLIIVFKKRLKEGNMWLKWQVGTVYYDTYSGGKDCGHVPKEVQNKDNAEINEDNITVEYTNNQASVEDDDNGDNN